MNSFLQEVNTQGDYLKKVAAYYRADGAATMEQIAGLFREKEMDRVILTGMGSSQYAMYTVLSYLTGHGIPALCYSSFELSRFQFGQITDKTLVIAISQSGETDTVLNDVRRAKQNGFKIISFTKMENSTLAGLSDITFVVDSSRQALLSPVPNPFFGKVILAMEELLGIYFKK